MKLAIYATDNKQPLPIIYYFNKNGNGSKPFKQLPGNPFLKGSLLNPQESYLVSSERNSQIKVFLKPEISEETFSQKFGKQLQYKEDSIKTNHPETQGYLLLPNYLRGHLKLAFHDFVILEKFKPKELPQKFQIENSIKTKITITNISPKPRSKNFLEINPQALLDIIALNYGTISITPYELYQIRYDEYTLYLKFQFNLNLPNDKLPNPENYLFPYKCLELNFENNSNQTISDIFSAPFLDNYIKIKKQSRMSMGSRIENFNPKELGIGGLKNECQSLFRRAFSLRLADPQLIEQLGVPPPKGVILHGAPGCGKTLIARKISQMIGVDEPQIINGPEIFSKYVGDSEAKMREIFKNAIDDYKRYGNQSQLHVVIFDEFDSIGKSRHSSDSTGANVQSNLVNQLLSIMDGVDQIDNILVIGLTNRLDLIDTALLRPGRFEIHLNIGLPDQKDRLEILEIHLRTMTQNNLVSDELKNPDILEEIAKKTNNYTGAEIAGLVKSAVSHSLERETNLQTLIEKSENNHNKPITTLEVKLEDINKALQEIEPYFGKQKKELNRIFPDNFSFDINHNQKTKAILDVSIKKINKYLNTPNNTSLKLLFTGLNKVGKTTLMAKIALDSKINHMVYFSNYELIGLDVYKKANKLREIFQDSLLVESSLIMIDDLDQILEIYQDENGQQLIFSNSLLQVLKTLLTRLVEKKVIFLATINQENLLKPIENLFDELKYIY